MQSFLVFACTLQYGVRNTVLLYVSPGKITVNDRSGIRMVVVKRVLKWSAQSKKETVHSSNRCYLAGEVVISKEITPSSKTRSTVHRGTESQHAN